MENDVRPLSGPPHVLPDPQKGAPLTAPAKRDAPFLEPSNYLLKIPSQRTPQFPQRAPMERDALLQSFLLHLSLRVPSKWAPLHVPQQGSCGDRSFISRANGLFIHLCLSESPVRIPPTKNGENIWSQSTEPHMDGRPTYNGVRPGSPRGSLTTLQSLPQCHAAFSTIPSTLAWVDQSPVSQHVS
jgi:hypothetical protein